MSDPHASQARIARAAAPQDSRGCGLLITPRHVITCAHVVNAALDRPDAAADLPTAPVPVDLPLLAAPFSTTGRVIRWLPPGADDAKGPEDLAVLELAAPAPAGAVPASLLALEPPEYLALPVHCFGFPAGRDEGTRRPGTCRGENARGWVQLDVARGLVEGGFSGTAAWDPGRGGAVGLVVAARTADQSAFLIPTRTLFAAWPELDAAWRPRNPFKGLAAFGPGDRADFFGRAALTPPLAERVGAERLITLIGPSGSGKSSLIGAGLIPELTGRGGWRCLVARPGEDPFDGLAAVLVTREGRTLAERAAERERLRARLAAPAAGAPAGLIAVLAEYLADAPGTRLLLVLDQFEEVFTNTAPRDPQCARDWIAALVALCAAAVPVHLLVALRADFMGAALDSPYAAPLKAHPLDLLEPLDGPALRAAAQCPADALGVRLAPGLVDTMVADLEDQPGRLPLLQFALTLLWDEQRARVIDGDALGRIGGVRGAIARYADGVIAALPEAQRPAARRILVQLVRPGDREGEGSRQVASLRRIPAGDQHLLPRLAESRLIVTAQDAEGRPVAEIAHESLIREWGTLKGWVGEDHRLRSWQEGLRGRMAEWEAHARDPGYLIAGPPLVEAEGWLTTRPVDLSRDDQDYIRTARCRADRQTRRVRATVAAVILVLAGVGALAGWQWRRALEKEQQAVAAADRATRARGEAEVLVNFMVFDLRDKLAPLGRLDLMAGVQERVEGYYGRLGVEKEDLQIQHGRIGALVNRGNTVLAGGDLMQAAKLYGQAKEIAERLIAADPGNADWQRDLSVSLEKIGDIRQAQGDLAGALSAYEDSRKIRERLATADPGNAGWQRDLSVSLEKIGDIRKAQGDLAGALSAYEEGRKIRERLAAADPSNAGWQLTLAKSLAQTALTMAKTDPAESRARLARALGIVQALDQAGRLDAQGRRVLEALLRDNAAAQPAPAKPPPGKP